MIPRTQRLAEVRQFLRDFKIVGLLGPRQVGKTTLAREIAATFSARSTGFDLERPEDVAQRQEPEMELASLRGLVVIDEIQRRPDLFPVLRVLADRRPLPARFLVLGSASPELLKQSSESLAGRIGYVELSGFDLEEVPAARWERLWLRGGFPQSFLARSQEVSARWRRAFIWPPPSPFGCFPLGTRISRSARSVLHACSSATLVSCIRTWAFARERNCWPIPSRGPLAEGFALEQVVRRLRAEPEECYFWRTHQGAELDLLVVRGRRRLGFEFKRTTSPSLTPSMRTAMVDLKLESLTVVHAGRHAFALAPKVKAIPFSGLLDQIAPMK